MSDIATAAYLLSHGLSGAPTPPRDLELVHGHRLMEYTHKADAGGGSYAHGTALFLAPATASHSYVVWTLIWKHDSIEGGSWVVEQGDYCFTLEQAVERFAARGGEVA